jgi:chromosome segregation ATPase
MSTPDPLQPAPHKRPTVWIVLCCGLAVAVVGVGIWAYSAQSDADDAQAKLATAQEQAVKAATPAPTEAPTTAPTEAPGATATPAAAELDPATQQQFQQLADDLGATNANLDQLQQDLEAAAAKVKTAQQERDDAKGALDTAKADVAAVQARIELTRSCLSGTLNAVSSAFTSGGVDAAKQELQTIADNCKSVAAS